MGDPILDALTDLKNKKSEAEEKISSIITAFQSRYGIRVTELTFHHSMRSESKVPKKTDISIRIEID